MIKEENDIPRSSIISSDFGRIDYADSYMAEMDFGAHTVDYLTAKFFISIPGWAKSLLKLRNFLVRFIGLHGDGLPQVDEPDPAVRYEPGNQAVFFTVLSRNENEIVMGEQDKHLDFRTSMLIDRESKRIYVNTIVHFHNALGRNYFKPVKPFHKLIIKSMLKKFIRTFGK